MKHATLLIVALMASTGASAANFIVPSSTNLAGSNNVVTFDAAMADHVFFMDHRSLPLDSIKAWAPDGSPATPNNTLQGRLRTVFDLRLDKLGTWKIASEQAMIAGTFKLDGEERRVGGRPGGPAPGAGGPGAAAPRDGERRRGGEGQSPREDRPGAMAQTPAGPGGPAAEGPRRLPPVPFQEIPANATDVHLTEMTSRVETFVTAGEPTTTVFKSTGKGLELEPVTHPNSVVAGETAQLRFLIDGKPAGGLRVTVVPGGDRYRDEVGAQEFVTDKDGIASISWPSAGMYWIGAEAEDKNPSEKKAEARKMSYAATFEVATP